MKGYKIDVLGCQVLLKDSFLRAASRMDSPEYKEMMVLRRELPDYEFKREEPTKKKTTNKYKNLNYANMRGYIQKACQDTQKAAELVQTLDKVITLSKVQTNPYKYVRDWFEKQFPNYKSSSSEYNLV